MSISGNITQGTVNLSRFRLRIAQVRSKFQIFWMKIILEGYQITRRLILVVFHCNQKWRGCCCHWFCCRYVAVKIFMIYYSYFKFWNLKSKRWSNRQSNLKKNSNSKTWSRIFCFLLKCLDFMPFQMRLIPCQRHRNKRKNWEFSNQFVIIWLQRYYKKRNDSKWLQFKTRRLSDSDSLNSPGLRRPSIGKEPISSKNQPESSFLSSNQDQFVPRFQSYAQGKGSADKMIG